MIARTLLCAVALITTNALALPLTIPFTSTTRTNQDVAINGSSADVESDKSPPSALPLVTNAFVVGTTDFASASSINAAGLLTTSAEADSDRGFASSDATAEFVGTFIGRTLTEIQLGFVILSNVQTGTGASSQSNLFLTILSGSNTLYSNVFTVGAPIDIFVNVPNGALATLDVLLESATSVLTGGSTFNEASVTISATTVPEPAIPLLFLAAFSALILTRRIRNGRGH